MERLTERTADGILVKENYEKESLKTLYSFYGEKPNSYYSNCEEGYCAMEKLADYEDAEEHGRLIKLPCKIGDIIYRVNAGAKEPVIKMRVLQVHYKQLREDRIIISIDAMNDNDMGESCYLLEDFGKNVFVTKSEAEAKLKELRGEKMAQWNRNTVPKCKIKNCSDEVLATVEHIGYGGKLYRRVIKAVYFPYHHCTVEDMGWNMCDGIPDDWEYCEEQDTWWIPQGWYEVCDYSPDYSYFTIDDKVTAWMKLPKAYEPRLKEFGGGEYGR